MRPTYRRMLALTVLCAYLALPSLSFTEPHKTEQVPREQDGKAPQKKISPGQRMDGAILEDEDLKHSMLAGVRLRKAKLKGANLELAMLAGADLREADLEYANLKQAMLLGANLSRAKLLNTNFEDANLLGASLEGARIEGASFKNAYVTQDQIDEACGKPRALPRGLKVPKPC